MADGETDSERRNIYNGILRAPYLDAAVDRGFITAPDGGVIMVSDALDVDACAILSLGQSLRVSSIGDCNRSYRPWRHEDMFNDHLTVYP